MISDHAIRDLRLEDWPEVRQVYEEGIATRQATFETSAPTWAAWDEAHLAAPRLVAERGGEVVGFAALTPVSPREVYRGVADLSVYVAAHARGGGIGKELLDALIDASERAGIWTLTAGVFPENEASLRLHKRAGFRVVGRHERLGRLDRVWRDVVLLERRSPVVG